MGEPGGRAANEEAPSRSLDVDGIREAASWRPGAFNKGVATGDVGE